MAGCLRSQFPYRVTCLSVRYDYRDWDFFLGFRSSVSVAVIPVQLFIIQAKHCQCPIASLMLGCSHTHHHLVYVAYCSEKVSLPCWSRTASYSLYPFLVHTTGENMFTCLRLDTLLEGIVLHCQLFCAALFKHPLGCLNFERYCCYMPTTFT